MQIPRAYLNSEYLEAHFQREQRRLKMQLAYSVLFAEKCARTRRVRKVAVLPLPMNHFQPAETYVAWKVLKTCGARICDADNSATDLAFAWHPSTQYELDRSLFERFEERHPVINARCTDIRKSRVGEIFREVFGYSLEIDPLTYDGVILRKSERNGAHDGVLLQGPLASVEPGYVYQRCVDFKTPKGFAEWRVYVVAASVVAVHLLYMPSHDRFDTHGYSAETTTVPQAFSKAELENIARFASFMHLDLGALDVLRDAKDGRIYICDCNNTPTGPPKKLGLRQQFKLIRHVTDAFEAAYLA